MKKRVICFFLILAVLFTMAPTLPVSSAAAEYEYAWFPAPQMYLTQLAYESYSHGSQNAIDIAPGGNVFAPFSGKIVYVDSNWGYVVLQSTNKVYYADGTLDYMTVGFMHDEDISDLYVGKTIAQGTAFYQAGGMGDGNPDAYGDHVHITVHKGQVTRGYPYGNGDVFAYKAFFINTAKTTSIGNRGKMASGNYMLNDAPSDWSNLWTNLSDAKFTVTFNANGGTSSASTVSVKSGSAIGTLPTATKEGYTFAGWYTAASGGTQVTASTIVTSNLTVYAHWTEKPKTVTLYDASGSVWKTGSCAAGSAYTLPDTYPTKSGSYFSGWSYQQNAEVFDIRPGDSIDIPADVSLYPVYVTHAQAITGEPVLIYNIADFTEDGYTISEEVYELTREVDASYWTDWSAYSTTAVKASDTVEVKTTAMYRYYYYLCPGCGDHNPLAGGCGCGSSSYDWHETWSTIAYSKSNYSTVSYATSKCSTTSLGDGQLWYFSAGNKNDTAIGTSDSDSSSTVIATGYSSRSYVAKTETKTQMVVAYQLTAVTVSSVEISSMPSKTTYEVGESLDTTGLSVKVTYSDGSTKTLDSGYTVSGFDSTSAGKKTVTVSYKGKNTTFAVTVNKAETVEPSDAQFIFESKSVSSGQTITVEITAANVPAISSLMLENFQYDSDILEFVSAELHLNATISEWDPADMSAVAAFSGNTDINGLVMTMTFQVKEGAEGDSTITCNAIAYEIPESGGQTAVDLTVVPGTITALAYERGDVNGDGYVNSNDAIYLLRYTLSPSRYPINQSGDMNGDGYVNSNDAIYLLRYTLSPSRYPLS